MSLAPIVLFVYNRPWHTEQTLNMLAQNKLAADSVLYIYADGPKENTSVAGLKKIEDTRTILTKTKWCKEVNIIESKQNKGLEKSVIEGVTEVLQKYGKVIVLEDDLLVSKGFLGFMNEALNLYENEKNVAGISGWSFPIKIEDETYFSKVGSCWGWATWDRVWKNVNWNSAYLIEKLIESNRIEEYNIEGSYNFFSMLHQQNKGQISSWAVRFYTSYFLNNDLFLFPGESIVQNIGLDGSGTNIIKKNEVSVAAIEFKNEYVNTQFIPVQEKKEIRKKIVESFSPKKIKKGSVLRRILTKLFK